MNRRRFVIVLSIISAALQFPISACRRAIWREGDESVLTSGQKRILLAVLDHLLPSGSDSPGATDINALDYLARVLKDPSVNLRDKKLIKSGIQWTEDKAYELFKKPFILLDPNERESVLRELESGKNGRDWLKEILNYLMEAMLGDPVYQINTDQIGWKMLGHIPGSPRPDQKTKYTYL